jgi:hypothetical protein
MTLEETNLTVDQVQSVRDRSLEKAYDVHDVGYEILVRRLQRHGFHVEDHGDDARELDRIVMGDGPDLRVYDEEDGDLLGYVEIKTKESAEWFGRCNRRHFNEYVNHENEVDVPVFIWFALVDADDNVCKRDGFFRVEDTDQIEGEVRVQTQYVFEKDDLQDVTTTDDGRKMVKIDHSDIVNVERGDQIVDSIPEVHGNEVVCLDENQIRSTPYILDLLDK